MFETSCEIIIKIFIVIFGEIYTFIRWEKSENTKVAVMCTVKQCYDFTTISSVFCTTLVFSHKLEELLSKN